MNLVQISNSRKQDADFFTRWKRLALVSRQADPCCCAPAWNLAYHQIFHPEEHAFAAFSEDAQVSFYESRLQNGSTTWLPLEDSWMFSQPLLGFDSLELLKELLASSKDTPIIVLGGVRENSALARGLFLGFSSHFNFFRAEAATLCAASLFGGLDGWLARRSGNFRSKLKKALRNSSRITYEKHVPTNREEAAKIYERMLKVEEKSWKGIHHCGMAESPSREFYGELLAILSENGHARIIIAKDEAKDIGYIFGSCLEGFYRGQQFSFDQEYAPFSLGNLLQYQKIKWLCEDAIARYDMGPITGPRMGYKAHWTEERIEINTWIMRPI